MLNKIATKAFYNICPGNLTALVEQTNHRISKARLRIT